MSLEEHGAAGGENRADPIRAAEYVRMSTEHQRYSTLNQAARIRDYARTRGYEVVRTYADEGISGLTLRERPALQRLLEDVDAGDRGFDALLVYDVSRWGRFQDPDESAAYELRCRRAGVSVHYCAEQFENDGSIASTIIKSVKRAMAGEYSRELSVRVFAGGANLIRHGFRQGGSAGFGLRKMLVDEAGSPKHLLRKGERKSIATDRIILVPGPRREIAIVGEIFERFTAGWNELRIAADLNHRRILTDHGRRWTARVVYEILTNEKYIGNNVWARTSTRLKQRSVRNDRDQWIRSDGAFEAIVDPELFRRAGELIFRRSRKTSNEAMLDALRDALARRGNLSETIIRSQPGMASTQCYHQRFGGLLEAYRQIGFSPPRDFSHVHFNRRARRLHADVLASVIDGIAGVGGTVEQDPDTDQLRINGELRLTLLVARQSRTRHGKPRWRVRLETCLESSLALVARMAEGNECVRDYYLLPMDQGWPEQLILREDNGLVIDAYRNDRLAPLIALAARAAIGDAR
jgi:DNA invertase Pin-like site-specific DNA recombinase